MLSSFHTHTTFCDGKSTPEEIAETAYERGFSALGFSGHGYTDFDHTYCMKDTEGYCREVLALKEEYKGKMEIYLGVEEDAFCYVDRSRFDYILGSSHYVRTEKGYLPIDSNPACFSRCLDAFSGDAMRFAEVYYENFCAYIHARRPDIVGHFDLVSKFSEVMEPNLLASRAYSAMAERYMAYAAESGCIFEVNTGAISRGYRTSPYPAENLLHVLKKRGGRIILCSDSHHKDTLSYAFEDTAAYLKDIGFSTAVTMQNGKFVDYAL